MPQTTAWFEGALSSAVHEAVTGAAFAPLLHLSAARTAAALLPKATASSPGFIWARDEGVSGDLSSGDTTAAVTAVPTLGGPSRSESGSSPAGSAVHRMGLPSQSRLFDNGTSLPSVPVLLPLLSIADTLEGALQLLSLVMSSPPASLLTSIVERGCDEAGEGLDVDSTSGRRAASVRAGWLWMGLVWCWAERPEALGPKKRWQGFGLGRGGWVGRPEGAGLCCGYKLHACKLSYWVSAKAGRPRGLLCLDRLFKFELWIRFGSGFDVGLAPMGPSASRSLLYMEVGGPVGDGVAAGRAEVVVKVCMGLGRGAVGLCGGRAVCLEGDESNLTLRSAAAMRIARSCSHSCVTERSRRRRAAGFCSGWSITTACLSL